MKGVNNLISRRRVLRSVVGLIGLQLLARPWAAPAAPVAPAAESVWRGFEGIFSNPGAAVEVGQRYLRCRPDDANPDWLARQLVLDPTALQTKAGLGAQQALRQHLTERVRADYQSGNTVQVGGWILSLTEARSCALLACALRSGPMTGL